MVELLKDFRTWPVELSGGAAAQGRGRTIILTTHQAHLAEPLAETTMTMKAGTIVSITNTANGTAQQVGQQTR
jgi:ABC-type polar amino acid transport system ATPase subunit